MTIQVDPWAQAQGHLQNILDEHSYKNWFSQTRFKSYDDGKLMIQVPSEFFAKWLRDHYMDAVSQSVKLVLTDFEELHGDRHFSKGFTIMGGLARLEGEPVMIIGPQKGRTTKEKVERNFGMPKPEGYRKALRLMEMAERFKLPVVTLIDTPGAYPGIDSEERGISEAIAQNLAVMSRLATPIVCIVIGEGSSGGALGIGVGDHLSMLQYSTYFVISPEGCANIIWKDIAHAPQAAEAMGVTSKDLQELGIVDATIPEPLGGAHRDVDVMAQRIGDHIVAQLDSLQQLPVEDLLAKRFQRLMSYGN